MRFGGYEFSRELPSSDTAQLPPQRSCLFHLSTSPCSGLAPDAANRVSSSLGTDFIFTSVYGSSQDCQQRSRPGKLPVAFWQRQRHLSNRLSWRPARLPRVPILRTTSASGCFCPVFRPPAGIWIFKGWPLGLLQQGCPQQKTGFCLEAKGGEVPRDYKPCVSFFWHP